MSPQSIHPDIVREAIASGISKAELARRSGLHENSIPSADDHAWNPKWFNLVKLCAAVEMIRKEQGD